MSGTASPTAAYVDATGIHAPSYQDIVTYLGGQFAAIYGADIVITPDTQDGQLIGIFALAISDANAAAIGAYNSFSPGTAQGTGLSSVVKINGIARHTPSNSTVPLLIVGVAGTTILNGQASDPPGNLWNLPASVIIPPSGQIIVTGTCAVSGAVLAGAGTITRISTVTLGWQTVTNTEAATPGAPVEDDADLRQRQSESTALPSLTVLAGMIGAVAGLDGVVAVKGYENDTNTDYTATTPPVGVDPLPPHSVSLVVQGGDATEICQTILLKKTPGCYTYGTTRETVNDPYGLAHDIGFFIPTQVAIGVHISLHALAGYTSLIGQAISQSVADYINGLGSGVAVVWSKLWGAADAPGGSGPVITYDITALTVATPPTGTYATVNIPITIHQIATCATVNVIITVV